VDEIPIFSRQKTECKFINSRVEMILRMPTLLAIGSFTSLIFERASGSIPPATCCAQVG
jgi:hypothetical protein